MCEVAESWYKVTAHALRGRKCDVTSIPCFFDIKINKGTFNNSQAAGNLSYFWFILCNDGYSHVYLTEWRWPLLIWSSSNHTVPSWDPNLAVLSHFATKVVDVTKQYTYFCLLKLCDKTFSFDDAPSVLLCETITFLGRYLTAGIRFKTLIRWN